jgi:5-methylcytosine-specific restriction endonuclease McrA
MVKKKVRKKRAGKKVARRATRKKGKKVGRGKSAGFPAFKLSPKVRRELPKAQQKNAEKDLWEKSGGICALCDEPLGDAPEHIVPDHKIAVADNGKTTLTNLYLAHKSCNSSRQHLPFNVAKPLVKFKVLSDTKSDVTFEDVLDGYVDKPNRQVKVNRSNGSITLSVGSWSRTSDVFSDPATKCEYFFTELPVSLVRNDAEVQPRLIMHLHVRKLALDFTERPVHEPSNCRLVYTGEKTGKLLQFDGQHKTTAQILIGRKSVPVKVYIEPDIPMLQQLVVKIQQEIKKQPLTRSDTLAKLGDVIVGYTDNYKVKKGQIRTEVGFVRSQPDKKTKAEVKKLYFEELRRIIFFSDENKFAKLFKPGVPERLQTDKVIIDKMVKPLIYSQLLDIDMDESGGRDNEKEAIVLVLNKLKDEMLGAKVKDKKSLQHRRAKTFFLGGAIGWWMQDILIPSIRYATRRIGDKKPLFIDPLSDDERSDILSLLETLCAWPIWSQDDEDVLRAMRSNTVKNVRDILEDDYDVNRLITEALN